MGSTSTKPKTMTPFTFRRKSSRTRLPTRPEMFVSADARPSVHHHPSRRPRLGGRHPPRRRNQDAVGDAIKEPAGKLEGLAGRHRIDVQRHAEGRVIDLLIACISALILIFAIMLLITRSVVVLW